MKSIFTFCSFAAILLLTSCSQNSTEGWEDVKTAGRYLQRGVDGLWGKEYESRMLASNEEFVGPFEGDFIPLKDSDLKNTLAATDIAIHQPKISPGQKGIPTLNQFNPIPESLKNIFRKVHFETDEHVLRDAADTQAIQQMSAYLKKNPNVYLVISGNCDERASASYNMALGMRRANSIRGLLVKNGVDANRLYTVSKGKEDPIAKGHSSEDWKLNRRAEFKIFEK
jgi:outer membrane protein OmpA-like peptidoglycan-associated protein